MARIVLVALALCLVPPPPPAPDPPATIVLPPGWAIEVYAWGLQNPSGLRWDSDGRLLVGCTFYVAKLPPGGGDFWEVVAEGNFAGLFVERASDGTLYIADPIWQSWDNAYLWGAAPGSTAPYPVVTHFKYCEGIVELPGGDLLAVDPGFIGTMSFDGNVVRIPPGAAGTHISSLPREILNPLRNPIAIELGPDGRLYLLDRMMYGWEPGHMLRWTPGEDWAETFAEGLNDPVDFAWAADGSIFITDADYAANPEGVLLRRDPLTGQVGTWATGFPSAFGVVTDGTGDIYLADSAAGFVYRIYPLAGPIMSVEPETLTLSSQGKPVLARVRIDGADLSTVAITAVDGAPVGPIAPLRAWSAGAGFHAQFDRSALQAVLPAGVREVRLTGFLLNGNPFFATDVVRVIGP